MCRPDGALKDRKRTFHRPLGLLATSARFVEHREIVEHESDFGMTVAQDAFADPEPTDVQLLGFEDFSTRREEPGEIAQIHGDLIAR